MVGASSDTARRTNPGAGGGAGGSSGGSATKDLPAVLVGGERHTLAAEEELRVETAFAKNSQLTVVLQRGACELFGVELALHRPYVLGSDGGGLKLAFFTWHGCVVDVQVSDESHLESSYVTDETQCNVAYVNTHAQLEALRDEAAAAASASVASGAAAIEGPRVLIVGPSESGKSSLAKVLVAYATKLGRTPILVDLDPCDNLLSVPGTLAAAPMNRDVVTVESFAACATPPTSSGGGTGTASSAAAPTIALWHGSSKKVSPDLFREQVAALGRKIDKRLAATSSDNNDNWGERSSGIIVNTNGWIRDEGYQLLLDAVRSLKITVVLVTGHDRLYSMMKASVAEQDGGSTGIKVIKVPRSGGVVSRDAGFVRRSQSRTIQRYFYGDRVEAPSTAGGSGGAQGSKSGGGSGTGVTTASAPAARVPQLTPFLLQLPIDQVTVYKFSSMSLSSSLLPVAAAQATEAVQLEKVEVTEQLQHAVLAVCHPQAVAAFAESGRARDLCEAGVAGFCAVERVLPETDRLHLLCPCAGSLPSYTLLVGDVTWME